MIHIIWPIKFSVRINIYGPSNKLTTLKSSITNVRFNIQQIKQSNVE